MKWIDLRSDTVSLPTPEMMQAMANAPLGDDVFGDDPTVNRLQEMAAERLGKEAALFMPSGTMANLTAVLTHCRRGDEVILGNKSHTFLYEAGGISALGGVHSCQVPNQPDGTMLIEDIVNAIRGDNIHFPRTRLICLENTHNRCGGMPLPLDYHQQVYALAQQYGIQVHIDGARVFNAAVALKIKAADIAQASDSITFCLSKGLCAPIGSVLCGSRAFIDEAKRIRKQLGGGMRQVGVIAAAGIVALEKMTERLEEDHQRAKTLAEGLSSLKGITFPMGMPTTNMVFIELVKSLPINATQLIEQLKQNGLLAIPINNRQIRLVTRYWINDNDIANSIGIFEKVFKSF